MNDAPTKPVEPKHRHRKLVWALVVLASIVLVVSMIANWVQTEVLDSNQFSNNTEQILQNKDVQEQLSIFAVDQLYANVDVQAQIEQKLPAPAQPLAAPVTAATRQLATNVAETALASPRVQQLVATAISGAQQRFVSLIENKDQFVSTQGGDVTIEYGSFVADLATRLGVDPSTISQIQGFIQQFSTELKQRLTTLQSKIESTRATLSQAQAGTLSPEAQQNLTTLETDAAQLHVTVASLEQKIAGIQPKAPASSRAGCPTSRAAWPSSTSGWPRCSDRPPPYSRIQARRTSSSSTPRSPRSRRVSPRCSTVRQFSTPARSS